jgi:hypothetical protein
MLPRLGAGQQRKVNAERCFQRPWESAPKSTQIGAPVIDLACSARTEQRRRGEARQMLKPVHGWFTEGSDTAALKNAKALLDELA